MSVLSDWEIKELAEQQEMISPFIDYSCKEKDGKRILSYGLGSYGYDIRLSPSQCLVFGGTQRGDCDPKNFDSADILKPAELLEDENGQYFMRSPKLGIVVTDKLRSEKKRLMVNTGKLVAISKKK